MSVPHQGVFWLTRPTIKIRMRHDWRTELNCYSTWSKLWECLSSKYKESIKTCRIKGFCPFWEKISFKNWHISVKWTMQPASRIQDPGTTKYPTFPYKTWHTWPLLGSVVLGSPRESIRIIILKKGKMVLKLTFAGLVIDPFPTPPPTPPPAPPPSFPLTPPPTPPPNKTTAKPRKI